jgi:hypothetical protein
VLVCSRGRSVTLSGNYSAWDSFWTLPFTSFDMDTYLPSSPY